MKKTLIFVIVAIVAALSVFAAASADKAKKNADLDSIFQTVQQSRHELAMMQHVAKALHDGATIEEIHEHFQAQAEKHESLSGDQQHVVRVHADMSAPKLKGSHQDKLNQLADEAEKLQKQIRELHELAALHIDGS